MFDFGGAELVVLCLLALIFFGSRKLPALAPVVRARMPAPEARRWSWSEWLLVCAALASGVTALQLLFGFQR